MTDDPHAEPLAVYELDGLCLPDEFIGYDGGLVVRTPRTTQQINGWWGAAFVGTVSAGDFGEHDYNERLAPDRVSLKKYGEDEQVYRVDVPEGGSDG